MITLSTNRNFFGIYSKKSLSHKVLEVKKSGKILSVSSDEETKDHSEFNDFIFNSKYSNNSYDDLKKYAANESAKYSQKKTTKINSHLGESSVEYEEFSDHELLDLENILDSLESLVIDKFLSHSIKGSEIILSKASEEFEEKFAKFVIHKINGGIIGEIYFELPAGKVQLYEISSLKKDIINSVIEAQPIYFTKTTISLDLVV